MKWGYVGLLEQYSPSETLDGEKVYIRFYDVYYDLFDYDKEPSERWVEIIDSEEYEYIKAHTYEESK